ncbi:MAG TPA: nuclear transport factor 2 family protein [Steroidobacteraceae bacterium]|jgi:ketosteroid isomerase-like protein|nr:nuclear transport factor 2 family protein [Steroidobacteraceae bacterium]
MGQANTQSEAVVRTFFELLNADNLEALRTLLTEDAAWLPQARDMPGAGEYRGRDVIVDQFLRPIRALFARGSPSNRILSMASNGDLVLVETHGTGHLSDGRPYDNRYAWAFEVRAGKVAVIREYLDSYYIVRLFGAA